MQSLTIETITKTQQNKILSVAASRNLFQYCQIVDSIDFYNEQTAPYLKEVCDAIQEFENDDNEALIVCMPPRHRKNKNNK